MLATWPPFPVPAAAVAPATITAARAIPTPADLKAYEKTLHAKLAENHSSNQRLPDLEGRSVLIVHRVGTDLAETHENAADFLYVIFGEADVVVGGTMVDGKTTGPGEIRGASVNGGETRKASAGDVLHIRPKASH
jgi:hypothetical protein